MSHLEPELEQLRRDIHHMIMVVSTQMEKSRDAVITNDTNLAQEVVANDRRVNGMELKIDRDCENALALYNPVANDLRLVLASLKINHNLERIGDIAEGNAKYMIDLEGEFSSEIVKHFLIKEMYDQAISMLDDVEQAFHNDDTSIARNVFGKDEFLNKINAKATSIAISLIEETNLNKREILYALSIVRKLERTGDLMKNLAEEIIFYVEAKVLKHRKKKLMKE